MSSFDLTSHRFIDLTSTHQSKSRSFALFFCLLSSGSLYSFTYSASAIRRSTNRENPLSTISKFSSEMLMPLVSLYLKTDDRLSVLQCWSVREPYLTLVCPMYLVTPSCSNLYTRFVSCSRGTASLMRKNDPIFFPLYVNRGITFVGSKLLCSFLKYLLGLYTQVLHYTTEYLSNR